MLERGAVEGQVFHRSAVVALAPTSGPVDGELVALVRKDLVRPEQPLLPDDDAYRFRHLLIRDTAYEALPKATRAELHERFADWLARQRERRWSSSTRSSAITSSRRTAIARSSGRSTTGPRRSPSKRRYASSRVAIMRSSAVTCMR